MTNKACILSVAGPNLLRDEAALFAEHKPWGVILMGRSCISKMQVSQLVEDIWNAVGREILIFIDQEGGRVQRLRPPHWRAAAPLRLMWRPRRGQLTHERSRQEPS